MSKRWYVINTYSGYEAKVKANLENRIKSMKMEDKIFQILIPSEEVTETRAGKKRVTNKNFSPDIFWWKWIWMRIPGQWFVTRPK